MSLDFLYSETGHFVFGEGRKCLASFIGLNLHRQSQPALSSSIRANSHVCPRLSLSQVRSVFIGGNPYTDWWWRIAAVSPNKRHNARVTTQILISTYQLELSRIFLHHLEPWPAGGQTTSHLLGGRGAHPPPPSLFLLQLSAIMYGYWD